jgi:tryptophanyl-tRNA synthetase
MLNDNPEDIHRKIGVALTDSQNSVSFDPITRPGVSNLLSLFSHFDPEKRTPNELATLHAESSLKVLKQAVADVVIEGLRPVRERYEEIMREGDGKYVEEIAEAGGRKASESAEETMVKVRQALSLERPAL